MIREATLADLPVLASMGKRFIAETPFAQFLAVNPAQIDVFLTMLITGTNSAVFVAERFGVVAGMLGIGWFMEPMSGEKTAAELFWWMNPEARGDGIKLLLRAEQWAVAIDAKVLQMVAPVDAEAVERLYQHRGYRKVQVMYQRRVAA